MKMKLVLTLLLAVCLVPAAQADLLGHWAFEEGTGTVVGDSSGNGVDGAITTITGDPTWGDGYFGGGLYFNGEGGTGDSVDLGYGASIHMRPDFTTCAWIRTTATDGEQVIISQRNAETHGWYRQWQMKLNASGQVMFYQYDYWGGGDGPMLVTDASVNDGQWHHVAAIRDWEMNSIYIDGELAGEVRSYNVMYLNSNVSLSIGQDIRDFNRSFDGDIDEVHLWTDALTAEEIQAVMNPVTPADHSVGVATDTVLGWNAPAEFTPVYYDLMFDGATVLTQTTETSYVPTLAPSTTYTWRVDAYEPNEVPGGIAAPVTGTEVSFTTRGPEPVFVVQPESTAAKVDDVVEFSVVAEQADTLTWFASIDPNNNTPADDTEIGTGSVVAVTIADAINVYCKASGVGDAYSDVASVRLNSLVGWYELNGNADDSGPNGNHGAVTELLVGPVGEQVPVAPSEGPQWTDGIHGQCLRVASNGSGYVEVAPADAEDYAFEERFSASAWVKSASTPNGYGVVVGMVLDSPSRPWLLRQSGTNDQVQFKTHNDFTAMGNSAVFDNEWHMLTGTWDIDTGERKLYVDGTLVDTQTGFTGLNNVRAEGAEVPLRIGYYKDAYTFSDALLDDVRLYDYALDAIEVAELYVAGVPGGKACVDKPEFDLDGSCVVDLGDLAMVAADWMNCNLLPTTLCN